MWPKLKGAEGGGYAVSILGTTKTSAFSANAQSRFASFVLDGVLGPPHTAILKVDFGRKSKSQSDTRLLLNFC